MDAINCLTAAYEYLQDRDVNHALCMFDCAERMGADPAQCAGGRWECWMLLGDFARAWQESGKIPADFRDPNRLWDGTPLCGKRVMIRCLHGYGDTIQFCRYLPLLATEAKWLMVEAEERICGLLRGVAGADHVITWGRNAPPREPDWDVQAEIMELPRIFRTTADTIPNRVPYIEIPTSTTGIGDRGPSLLRVGLAWTSGPFNPARSIDAEQLAPLFQVPGFDFVSLHQNNDPPSRALSCRWLAAVSSIEGTALAIRELDLVISVDTMVAHLAGALGKPVWTMLPFQADWRWMLDRQDSPWYPTMRLFRQPRPGDWEPVIAEVAETLRASRDEIMTRREERTPELV